MADRVLVLDLRETNPNMLVSLYVLMPLLGCAWIVGVAALISGQSLKSLSASTA